MHIFKRNNAAGFAGKGIGITRITVHREILAACRFANHQEHQRGFFVSDDAFSIIPQRLERHFSRKVRILNILESAVSVVRRDDLFIQCRVIAADRGIILIIKCGNTCNQTQRCQHGEQTVSNAFFQDIEFLLKKGGWQEGYR